jgi:threonyl-tRNA synthetase
MEWIHYIVVYGERERESGLLSVRKRATGSVEKLTLEDLIREIRGKIESKPFKKLPLPKLLSRRPSFK